VTVQTFALISAIAASPSAFPLVFPINFRHKGVKVGAIPDPTAPPQKSAAENDMADRVFPRF
jgi:hypothetical protein